MNLIFAPLKGLTDDHFRSFYFKHFKGFDQAVTPFLISSEDDAIKAQKEKKVIHLPLIPQLLGNRIDTLTRFSFLLADHGFTSFNLNLGCPAPLVIRKSKGAALLAEPERLANLIQELTEKTALPFSIKTRLGYNTIEELLPQLSQWKKMNISGLIIHARSAAQLYQGEVYWEKFAACADEWGRPIIYNGDVTTLEGYQNLKSYMGEKISGVMIGRGIFYNPFIAEEIKRGNPIDDKEKGERFLNFHRDITSEMSTRPKSFSRLKALWARFYLFAGINETELLELKRMKDAAVFNRMIESKIMEKYQL